MYFRGYYCLLPVKMPKEAFEDHEECRKLICAICLSESGQKCTRTVSDKEIELIREHISASYNIIDPRYIICINNTVVHKRV